MSKEYTENEYREVLMAILNMNSEEREKVFGEYNTIQGYIVAFSPSELIEKYRMSFLPKTGDCWKRNGTVTYNVIIRFISENLVYYYHCDTGTGASQSVDYFVNNFTKTEYHSKYIKAFLDEMKKIDEMEEERINKK